MVLDKEHHRLLLLEMFSQINFPGHALEAGFELKQAIKAASVAPDPTVQKKFDAAVDARDTPTGAPAPADDLPLP